VIEIVRSPTLFEDLGEHLDVLLPTIEASIVCQGGSVTITDGMYCFGRLFQSLASAGEVAVLAKLEKRFARFEMPLLIHDLNFHPMYAKIGWAIVDGGEVDVMTLTKWVNMYGDRWGHEAAARDVSEALAIQARSSGFGDLVTESTAFVGEACKY
jgi:hypothetical protein